MIKLLMQHVEEVIPILLEPVIVQFDIVDLLSAEQAPSLQLTVAVENRVHIVVAVACQYVFFLKVQELDRVPVQDGHDGDFVLRFLESESFELVIVLLISFVANVEILHLNRIADLVLDHVLQVVDSESGVNLNGRVVGLPAQAVNVGATVGINVGVGRNTKLFFVFDNFLLGG